MEQEKTVEVILNKIPGYTYYQVSGKDFCVEVGLMSGIIVHHTPYLRYLSNASLRDLEVYTVSRRWVLKKVEDGPTN